MNDATTNAREAGVLVRNEKDVRSEPNPFFPKGFFWRGRQQDRKTENMEDALFGRGETYN